MTQQDLAQARRDTYGGPDRDLFLDLGFFVAHFGAAELSLTLLLAILTDSHDMEIFDLLCAGMDARVKLQRLRSAAERKHGIGPNLKKRFDHFEIKTIKLRNKIAHSAFSINEDTGPTRYFLSTLSSLPYKELGFGTSLNSKAPYTIEALEIYREGCWLSGFRRDLHAALPSIRACKPLEVDDPISILP